MITAVELEKMPQYRRKEFCKTILACVDAWYAEDPAREAAYQEWLPKYLARQVSQQAKKKNVTVNLHISHRRHINSREQSRSARQAARDRLYNIRDHHSGVVKKEVPLWQVMGK